MAERVVAGCACLGKVGPGCIGELHGKLVFANLQERVAEFVDGIVANGDGTVTAGVYRFESEALGGFLADLNVLHDDFAVAVGAATAALVQGKGGGDEVGLILGKPVGSIEGDVGLLAAGECELDGALW